MMMCSVCNENLVTNQSGKCGYCNAIAANIKSAPSTCTCERCKAGVQKPEYATFRTNFDIIKTNLTPTGESMRRGFKCLKCGDAQATEGGALCLECSERIKTSLTTAGGTKFDGDKARTDLLDPIAMEATAAVLAAGAKKYAEHNWRKGFKWSRLIGAALRHLFAFMRGEDLDPETGLPHVDHLACCVMFLQNHYRDHKELDDRYKPTSTNKTTT